MPRPKIYRCLRCKPRACFFKPRGIPLNYLIEEVLLADELEALKLHDVDGLDQKTAAEKMRISQPTFGRILNRAYKKISRAIVFGRAIKIETAGNRDEV